VAYRKPIPDDGKPNPNASGFGMLVQAEKLMQIALVMPSAVFVCWLAGWWADKQFHQHWITGTGIAFGSVAGLVYVIRMAFAAEKAASRGDSDKSQGGSGN
jgi:hypothetical protein